jgi:hypothetical protein
MYDQSLFSDALLRTFWTTVFALITLSYVGSRVDSLTS